MLHIICGRDGLKGCQRFLDASDSLLFIGDGAYVMREAATGTLLVIEDDALARGIPIPESVQPVSYTEFVTLVATSERSATWK